MRHVSYVSIGFVLCVVLWAIFDSQSRGEESKELGSLDFGDRVVLLSIGSTSGIEHQSSSVALMNAKLVKMGDRYFMRGKVWVSERVPDQLWQKDVDGAVSWQDVIQFYVFSEEEMERYTTRYLEKK